jgi:putative membrane protein
MVGFDDWGPGRMAHRQYGGAMMDGGTGWFVLVLVLVLVLVVVLAGVAVYVAAVAARSPRPPSSAPLAPPSPRDLLDRRLASGEITPEEYGERRQLLDH